MIVECRNQFGEPRAIEMDPANRAYGWVYYKHPDGQWVTLRPATDVEMRRALESLKATSGGGWAEALMRAAVPQTAGQEGGK